MRKSLLLLILFLCLTSNNIFAQNTERMKAINDELDLLVAIQNQAKAKKVRESIAQRNKIIEETLRKIERETGKKKIPFSPAPRYNAYTPAKRKVENPLKFFSIENTGNALNFYSESENQTRKIASSSSPERRSRLLLEERLETDFKGSVYHPNFAAFDINLDNGLRQSREKFQPNLSGKLQNGPLNYFHTFVSFLQKKPYAFSLSADKSRDVQNREFFERQVVNATSYGGNFGFKNTVLPVGFSFSNCEKKIDREINPSQNFIDDKLNFNMSNQSTLTGETHFDAAQDKFSRTESGTPDQKGTSRDFNLLNRKFLTQDERKMLYSSLHFYDLTGTSKSSILSVNEDLNIKHTDYLDSSYTYYFADKSSSGVKAQDNRISASLRHRLYESLKSSFSPYYFKSDGNTFSQNSYGLTWDEDYVKKLGKIGKISSGIGFNYSEEKRKSPNNIISIIDESHVLSTGTITFLDQPGVDTATVVVTNSNGTITYSVNIDYLLTNAGERTQIQRIPGSSIANGDIVLVDYQATGNPSAAFNTLWENYRLRIDFLDELIGIYYRFSDESHPKVSDGRDLILQSLRDTVAGIDFNYKNFRLEFMDEFYDSSLSPYRQQRVRESFFFNPTEKSTLTFQSSQSIVKLIDAPDTQKFFDFISRYSAGINRYSRLFIEGGFRWQQGSGIGLNDITAGSGYELNLGKLFMNIRYDFKRQFYLSDRWINHFLSILIKRTF
jgi:hypothetical protein